ncbi:GNAT family N-acetyltransferase [Bacillus sp. FJAT-27251]|uniref:GNAT family N-acetyltransferase n=1 Tax=Bacillus sp. FJAT-27251 TaxID=1684142 RepID=UPI0006A7AF22|nr:GNAT family N-acetyltransferase [Bacillus sp. FJAT-27251]
MAIRKATQQELQEILGYSREVFQESTMGLVEAAEIPEPLFSEGDGFYLVYSENNVIKGWIGMTSTWSPFGETMVGVITEVYVLPDYRRSGIARQLCIKGMNALQEQGHHKVQLNVFAGNDAKQLYHKLGFHEVSILMERRIGADI